MDWRRQLFFLRLVQSWRGPRTQPGDACLLSRNNVPRSMLWGARWARTMPAPAWAHTVKQKQMAHHADRDKCSASNPFYVPSSGCVCPGPWPCLSSHQLSLYPRHPMGPPLCTQEGPTNPSPRSLYSLACPEPAPLPSAPTEPGW